MGKEYDLCRVKTIRVAVSTVKDGWLTGQVSVLVSVFGGKNSKPEHLSGHMTMMIMNYYYCGLTMFNICIIEYPWDGSTSWILVMIDRI